MRRIRACTVVVTLVLAGCGANPPASTTADTGLMSDPAAVDLLTRSGSYHARQHTLTVAEEMLVGRCMAARGLAYPARMPAADRRSDEDRALEMDKRRQIGYGLFQTYSSTPAERDRPVTAADRYVKGLAPDEQAGYLRALFGANDRRRGIDLPGGQRVTFAGEGCVFEAHSRLFGDIITWARITYVPEELDNKLIDRATSSDEYAQAMRGWSRCMARRGHKYSSPRAAEQDLTARYQAEGASEQLRRRELEVAVADGDCARQAGVPGLVLSLKKSHLNTLSDDEQRSIQHLAGRWVVAAAAAQRTN